MNAERARLVRLRRLETIRAAAKRTAAQQAAAAESTLAQLEGLAARTLRLAEDYAGRGEARDGAALSQVGRFALGLQQLYAATSEDAHKARGVADVRMAELASAERRRAAVEERAVSQARRIAAKSQTPVLGGRKSPGADFE